MEHSIYDKPLRLLKKYWNIPERQVETSVVLEYAGNKKKLPKD